MKTKKAILLFFLFIAFCSLRANGSSELEEIKDFGLNPGNLKMFIHVPDSLPKTATGIPLVIALHGCSQNAKTLAEQSGWSKLSDEHQFIVIYPQQKRINNPSNCFNWFQQQDSKGEKGESASILSMIHFGLDNYKIDERKVFVYGLSAGAAMSVNLLANLPCTFKAGAIFAGGPYGAANNAFQATKVLINPYDKRAEDWGALLPKQSNPDCRPHLIVVHGRKDKVVDPQNSTELIEQWTFFHQTDTIPDQREYSFASNPLVERISYLDSLEKEVIVYYKVAKTGHALPLDPGEGAKKGGKVGLFAVDRDFFSTWYVAKDFGLIKDFRD